MTNGLRAVWNARKILWWANIENWYLFQYEWNVRRGLSSLCTMHLIIFWGFVSSDFIQKEDMILMIEWWFSLRSWWFQPSKPISLWWDIAMQWLWMLSSRLTACHHVNVMIWVSSFAKICLCLLFTILCNWYILPPLLALLCSPA